MNCGGSPEFARFFSSLDSDCELYNRIRRAIEALRADMLVGEKIERKKWAKTYVKKYGIRNLFRMETGKESRLIYTIIAENNKKIVVVLEFFQSHKEYERRFGYS